MQKYQSDYLKSRHLTETDFIPCEFCGAEANDIHHILSSHRGMRTHQEDGSDLIALCRSCHTYIHAHNTQSIKESLLAVATYRLISIR